ncbi:hypothetical protein ACFQ4C_07610 [Larkinella insperata]|uniref:Uncharacterized protein n=1 Tax=Larkinella insperata TaxID=332158 RepID=A0ABW3QHI2_9BACT
MSQTSLETSPALSALESTTTTMQITNSSGVSVVVLDASSNPPSPTQQLFDQTLSWLTTADLLNTIPPRTTKTIPLPAAQLDDNGLPIDLTLILADAQTLAPLKVVDLPALNPAPATELTEADLTASKQAQEFVKTITAFPSSSLVTDYLKALDDPDPTALPAFFAATTDFKQVSLELVVAFQTYFNRFPFYLTGYTTARSFYLYSSDGTTNRYAGSVVLQNQSTAPSSVPNAIEGLEAMYVTTNGADYIPLSYVDGQFVDDPNSASPDYCLRGLFMLRSDLTKKPEDNQLIPILFGTVNGQVVFGYDVKQEKSPVAQLAATATPGIFKDLDVLVHPSNTQEWLKLIGLIAGGVLGIVGIGVGGYFLNKYLKRAPKLTPEQIQAKNQEIRELNRQRLQATLDKIHTELKVPDDIWAAIEHNKEAGNNLLLEANQERIKDMLLEQHSIVNTLQDLAHDTMLSRVNDNLSRLDDLMLKTEALDLGNQMNDIMTDLTWNTAKLADVYRQVGKALQKGEQTYIEKSQKAISDITTALEENEKMRQDILEDEIPEIPEIEG